MTNRKKEFFGIYAPTFYLLTTFFAQQFAQCVMQPPSDVTGPSGSSMMCLVVFFINLVFWIPAGVTCVILQLRRTSRFGDGMHSDLLRHNVSAAVGLMLLLFTAKSIQDMPELWPIIAIAGAVNLGICAFFFAIGCGLRSGKQSQINEETFARNRSHRVHFESAFPAVNRPTRISKTEQPADDKTPQATQPPR